MAQRKGRRKAERRTPTRGTAPSSPDLDHLEKMEASEEAKSHEPSDVDAMGQDKRRRIVGHAYGPSRRSQILFFVAVAALLVLIVGGSMAAIAAFDQPEDEYPDKAPWSAAEAEPIPTGDPSGPCGEPGSAFPFAADSPCTTGRTSENQPPAGSEADSSGSTAEGN